MMANEFLMDDVTVKSTTGGEIVNPPECPRCKQLQVHLEVAQQRIKELEFDRKALKRSILEFDDCPASLWDYEHKPGCINDGCTDEDFDNRHECWLGYGKQLLKLEAGTK
jgi:hypothetical protein